MESQKRCIYLTGIEKAAFKKRLLEMCVILIEQRIAAAAKAMAVAQEAANSEDKSSAGDKYETSRAMSHLEKDMHALQLAANRAELAALCSIGFSGPCDSAKAGCFVQCEHCSFFIAAGLGKIQFEGQDIYLLSPNAPLAKILFRKVVGDVFVFNKNELIIHTVF